MMDKAGSYGIYFVAGNTAAIKEARATILEILKSGALSETLIAAFNCLAQIARATDNNSSSISHCNINLGARSKQKRQRAKR
jgi:hypothetical protein